MCRPEQGRKDPSPYPILTQRWTHPSQNSCKPLVERIEWAIRVAGLNVVVQRRHAGVDRSGPPPRAGARQLGRPYYSEIIPIFPIYLDDLHQDLNVLQVGCEVREWTASEQ